MTAMNTAAGPFGGMGLINNGTNGATSKASSDQEEMDFEARLNTYIYDFFVRCENYECARSLLRSGVAMEPRVQRREEMNGNDDAMHTDSKDDLDSKRPDDLPIGPYSSTENSFLLDWFSCFWDFYFARTTRVKASQQAIQYLAHTQSQSRLRQEQQQQLLRSAPMIPANMDYQNLLRFQQNVVGMNGDLRQKALQNNRNGYPNQQQLAQLAANKQQQQQQLMAQQQMRRDPSDLDINGQRPRTPSSGENAPSPSKRPRLDVGVPGFSGPQMIPNGRGPPQGLQGQQMIGDHNDNANSLLMQHGINPTNLSTPQFNSFQNQTPQVQQKSIQVYAQNMANQQRQNMPKQRIPGQGSPMMQPGMELAGAGPGVPEYFSVNPAMAMRAPVQANGGAGGNHALQDYQMQLMLLEQQNKKRLLMARQEHDTTPRPDGQPGIPGAPGFAPGMSPQGSRSGPSPGPNDQIKRGTPKMGTSVLPGGGSPMPDGSMQQGRESPAAMNYNGQINQELYQMKMPEGMRPPPSSHPRFNNSQMTREQMENMRVNQMQSNGWAPQQGQAAIMQQMPQAQQPSQSTPQQRTMPPPTTLPAGASANGRPASPAVPAPAPPTPSTAAKANPKAKKNDEKTRKRPPKKTSGAGAPAAAAPANEPENPPPTPTPQTPVTPMNPNSFSKQSDGPNAAGPISAATSAPIAPPQPDPNVAPFMMDEANNEYNIGNFGTDMGGDVLENFDFDSFLQSTDDGGAFNFDAATLNFAGTDAVEAGAGDA